ncbi:L-threonine-O-3-phosphate decarboxylase CobB [Gottschalkia acidurici 9a]|uniref:threonine-phosphate decarboxylase n=1 Tax=Gottschalkia acidurici (strain ATCC 7906 / DSM 604 / BCRC 14475 / CIP 104303 / KCTC 5404 / NCIMB 10678 / 9a) TaxID=1128398 RepID=K0AXZ6_GOTA9|nr:threonine-phosphate decarboxylase CobD [Gottschalkia acidurici]AFS77652.1 L-threonine-O-3-phosphate decarboxylase CobB [Gottschalkia acidurici 9a]
MNKHGGYFGENKNKIIDFSVNINPLGVPNKLINRLQESLKHLERYPEIDGESGKIELSRRLNINTENIILGNGATELIYLFSRALKPKKVMIIEPTFTEYERAFKLNESEIYHFETLEKENFQINIERLLEEIEKIRPDLLVMCNPNNPTGIFTEAESMMKILNKLKEINSYLFIDESFIDFTDKKSYISFIESYPTFILRSMTKTYAIPGLRLGYGLGNKSLIEKLKKQKEPWTINSLALEAIPILLGDENYFRKTNDWYKFEKKYLKENLEKIEDIKTYESNGNFFLCKLKKSDSKVIKEYLLDKKIYIRTCEDFYGLNQEYLRLAIRTREENELLLKEIKCFFKKIK